MNSCSSTKCHFDIKSHIYSNVRDLAPTVRAQQELPANFMPANYDIICGKGKCFFDHIGNRRFRVTIEMHLPQYKASTTKSGKSAIVNNIVHLIRSWGPEGNVGKFMRFNKTTKTWIDLGDAGAREKVGQAIRDALTQKDPSKKKARKVVRQQKRRKQQETNRQPSLLTQMTYSSSNAFDDESALSDVTYASVEFEDCPEALIRMNLLDAESEIPDLSDLFADDEAISPELVTSSIFAL